jgi:hypothetical protein
MNNHADGGRAAMTTFFTGAMWASASGQATQPIDGIAQLVSRLGGVDTPLPLRFHDLGRRLGEKAPVEKLSIEAVDLGVKLGNLPRQTGSFGGYVNDVSDRKDDSHAVQHILDGTFRNLVIEKFGGA